MDREFRPFRVYSRGNRNARLQRDDEDNNNETDEVGLAEYHQRPRFVPGLPARDTDAPVPRFTSRVLPVTHDRPDEESWQWSVSICESPVEYPRNNDNPAYPPPTETFLNPDPLDLYSDVQIPFEPRSPSPVPGLSRQRDAPQQATTPGYFMLESSSTSTATTPAPSTSRQSVEQELPAKPKQHRKNTTKFLSRWQRRGEDPDTGTFRYAPRPYARSPRVTITPLLPSQTADAVSSSCRPSLYVETPQIEIELQLTRNIMSSPEQTAERSVDSPINPLLILSAVCSEELRLLEAGEDGDEKT